MRALAAALALVGLCALPASAQTAPAYGPPQPVLPCNADVELAATSDGSVYGVARDCDGRLTHLHRSPAGTWTQRALPLRGTPLAVADDGRTTFFLVTPSNQSADAALSVVKVPHDGPASPPRLLERVRSLAGADLVARDGRWWAVWTDVGPDRSTVREARSLHPATAARDVGTGSRTDVSQSLALRGTGAVLLLQRRSAAGATAHLASLDPDGRVDAVRQVSGASGGGEVVVSGGTTTIALREGQGLVALVDDGALRFARRPITDAVAPEGTDTDVDVAASGGRFFVGWSHCSAQGEPDQPGTYRTCRAYVTEGGLTGDVTRTDLSAAAGRKDVAWELDDLTAARGRATAVTSDIGRAAGTTVGQTRR